MIGKKAKVIDGFGMHDFKEGEIVTLVMVREHDGGETWYNFENEDGTRQALLESEFEFIEEDGE